MIKTGIIPQNTSTRISLVRHATVHNPSYIFYGRLPGFSLSKKGRIEAARVAAALKDLRIEGVFSSPLLRCRLTAAEILKYHRHIKLKKSALITEIFTPFQGQSADIADSRNGDVYTGADARYEQPEDILKRVQKFVFRTRRRFSGKHVVAVTHGDVVRLPHFAIQRILKTRVHPSPIMIRRSTCSFNPQIYCNLTKMILPEPCIKINEKFVLHLSTYGL
jgi:broad specificity phosphatase PhoE